MWTDEDEIADFWAALEKLEEIDRNKKIRRRIMNGLKFCKGSYLNKVYFIPTIEHKKNEWSIDTEHFLCLSFLKWYIGLTWYVCEVI